jgi:O-antigen/teichoic acid export membrane protein
VTPDLSKGQLVRNLSSNLAGFGLGILSNVVLTPYWIGHLGVAAYGLVPLTNSLVAYLGVITAVLSSSVSRFITIEVGRGDLARANRVFNTSFWGSIALAVAAVAIGGAASFQTNSLIAVPEGFRGDSHLMLGLGTLTFVVSLLQVPFGAATYCVNRLDLNNWVAVAMRVIQVVIGVGLVATFYARPGALMIASLAGALMGAAAAIFYWRRFMPWCRIAWMVDPAILRTQLSFGAWSVINLVGALLYMQIDLLVINRMLGPVPGGQYAALAQWSFLIRGLGGTVSTVLGPSITH